MTCTPLPFPAAGNPFLAASWIMFEQQMRMVQMMTEIMIRANPWIVLAEAGTIDPLTRDAALGAGDLTDDINLEAGVASPAAPTPEPVTPMPARAPRPAPVRTSAAQPAKAGAKPPAGASVTGRARRSVKPASDATSAARVGPVPDTGGVVPVPSASRVPAAAKPAPAKRGASTDTAADKPTTGRGAGATRANATTATARRRPSRSSANPATTEPGRGRRKPATPPPMPDTGDAGDPEKG